MIIWFQLELPVTAHLLLVPTRLNLAELTCFSRLASSFNNVLDHPTMLYGIGPFEAGLCEKM